MFLQSTCRASLLLAFAFLWSSCLALGNLELWNTGARSSVALADLHRRSDFPKPPSDPPSPSRPKEPSSEWRYLRPGDSGQQRSGGLFHSSSGVGTSGSGTAGPGAGADPMVKLAHDFQKLVGSSGHKEGLPETGPKYHHLLDRVKGTVDEHFQRQAKAGSSGPGGDPQRDQRDERWHALRDHRLGREPIPGIGSHAEPGEHQSTGEPRAASPLSHKDPHRPPTPAPPGGLRHPAPAEPAQNLEFLAQLLGKSAAEREKSYNNPATRARIEELRQDALAHGGLDSPRTRAAHLEPGRQHWMQVSAKRRETARQEQERTKREEEEARRQREQAWLQQRKKAAKKEKDKKRKARRRAEKAGRPGAAGPSRAGSSGKDTAKEESDAETKAWAQAAQTAKAKGGSRAATPDFLAELGAPGGDHRNKLERALRAMKFGSPPHTPREQGRGGGEVGPGSTHGEPGDSRPGPHESDRTGSSRQHYAEQKPGPQR